MTDYPDDGQRLTRLGEEVRGRLEEMALIAARIAGIQLDRATAPRFVPQHTHSTHADSAHGDVTMVEVFPATSSHDQLCVTWWADGTTGLDSPCGTEIYHSH